jgi:hypothetical protein
MKTNTTLKKNLYGILLSLLTPMVALGQLPASAAVTNIGYWRGGENDSPAPNFNVDPGNLGFANNTTVDLMVTYNLSQYGTGGANTGTAFYGSSAAYAGVGGLAAGSSVALIPAGDVGYYTDAIDAGTANFGFQAYVRPNNTTGVQVIAANGGVGNGWNLFTADGTVLGLAAGYRYFVEVAGRGILDSGITVAAEGDVANIAYVNNNGANAFYYNFAQVASANLGGIIAAGGNFSLGFRASDVSRYYTGTIDEARLFTFEEGAFSPEDLLDYVPGPTYASWATTNAGGQTADLDWDNDGVSNGVEFFMNAAPGFTANPGLDGSNKVTWINGGKIPSTGYGTQFVVQISSDLVTWEDVGEGNLEDNGGSLSYIVTGEGKQFVRLKVTPN